MDAYDYIWWLCKLIVHSFFANIQVNNANYVPQSGPIIFYGNHQNQFVDAMLLFSQTRRAVSFLMAKSSFSKYRGVLGSIARAMRAIPVRRRIDEAYPGTGLAQLVEIPEEERQREGLGHGVVRLLGSQGSRFLEQLAEGCQVDLGVHGVAEPPTVVRVESDCSALVSGTGGVGVGNEGKKYRVLP